LGGLQYDAKCWLRSREPFTSECEPCTKSIEFTGRFVRISNLSDESHLEFEPTLKHNLESRTFDRYSFAGLASAIGIAFAITSTG
jgi:hypothetical protein